MYLPVRSLRSLGTRELKAEALTGSDCLGAWRSQMIRERTRQITSILDSGKEKNYYGGVVGTLCLLFSELEEQV